MYSTYINNDKNYLQARENYVNECMKERVNCTNLKHNKNFDINSQDNIKQLYIYNDEYGRNKYYSIHTYKVNNKYESLGYESDENGECIYKDVFNESEVCNYGNSLLETHYTTVFDLNFESYGINNNC
jgi:hypothetical protein